MKYITLLLLTVTVYTSVLHADATKFNAIAHCGDDCDCPCNDNDKEPSESNE